MNVRKREANAEDRQALEGYQESFNITNIH